VPPAASSEDPIAASDPVESPIQALWFALSSLPYDHPHRPGPDQGDAQAVIAAAELHPDRSSLTA